MQKTAGFPAAFSFFQPDKPLKGHAQHFRKHHQFIVRYKARADLHSWNAVPLHNHAFDLQLCGKVFLCKPAL